MVPPLLAHDEDRVGSIALGLLASFVVDGLLDGFALGIEAIQLLSRLKRRQTIARSQHIEGILSRCQSSCRIHTRAKTKTERPSSNLGWLHTSHRQQCLKARTTLLLQHFDPPVHIGTVLIL